MQNPFELIDQRLQRIERLLLEIKQDRTGSVIDTINDRCNLSDAKSITGLSESKLYKLTATDKIPVRRYGKKLIFSRKELNVWVDSQTVSDNTNSNAVLNLADSANRRR